MTKSDFIKKLEAKHDHEASECLKKQTCNYDRLIVFDKDDEIYNTDLAKHLKDNFDYAKFNGGFIVKFDAEPVNLENKINDFFDKQINK